MVCDPKAESRKALLYRISGNGAEKPSHILGTHHFAPLSILDGIKVFDNILASSDVIVSELAVDDLRSVRERIGSHMTMPEGTEYADILSEEDYGALDRFLRDHTGKGLDVLGGVHPAVIGMMYTRLLYRAANPGFDPGSHISIDEYVQKEGHKRGITTVGLESAEDQISALFDSVSAERQIETLAATVKNMDRDKELLLQTEKLYREGDIEGIYELSFNSSGDKASSLPEEYAAALNRKRNEKWMEAIPGILEKGGAFIAVGALHLAGPEGILNRLEELGYEVNTVN